MTPRRELACVLPLLMSLICASRAVAQSSAKPESPQRVVMLSVGASNPQGAPVTDLRPADLQVREDGKLRPIIFLRSTGSKRAVEQPAPGEFTNHPEPTPTVILLDRLNDDLKTAAAASSGVGAVLQRMESADRVYIYFLTNTGELFPVQPLPSAEPDSQPVHDPPPAELCARLDEAVRKLNGFRDRDLRGAIMRANKTLQLLDALISQMDSLPGRKNLIWVTGGSNLIPATIADFTAKVRSLSAAAADSRVAIDAVDQSAGAEELYPNRVMLRSLSAATGGAWYFPANDVERAFADAIADARNNYRVAYYSSTPDDGKEHKIRVDSTRKGIRVRLLGREGATDQAAQPDADTLEETAFDDELRSSVDATGIDLRVGVSRRPGNAHFSIHIDPTDVLVERSGGNYKAHLTVLLAPFSDGFEPPPTPVHADINLTPEEFDKASKDGIVVMQDVAWNDKIQKMRVMVFDRGLHGIGSVTIPAQ